MTLQERDRLQWQERLQTAEQSGQEASPGTRVERRRKLEKEQAQLRERQNLLVREREQLQERERLLEQQQIRLQERLRLLDQP